MINPDAGSEEMTIRSYFAALAMEGLLAAEEEGFTFDDCPRTDRYVDCAEISVKHADALIAELNKPKEE